MLVTLIFLTFSAVRRSVFATEIPDKPSSEISSMTEATVVLKKEKKPYNF
jgi:hypothetical protein